MKKYILLFAAVIFASHLGYSQSIQLSPTVISSAGDNSAAGDISLSWTLGELAVSTLSSSTITLTQGFQQSYPPSVGFDLNPIDWKIVAYPNPVTDELKIQFDLLESTDFLIEIQDITGRLISQQEFKEIGSGDIVPFEMSSYKSGAYFFRISTLDREQVRVISIRKL